MQCHHYNNVTWALIKSVAIQLFVRQLALIINNEITKGPLHLPIVGESNNMQFLHVMALSCMHIVATR